MVQVVCIKDVLEYPLLKEFNISIKKGEVIEMVNNKIPVQVNNAHMSGTVFLGADTLITSGHLRLVAS